MSKIPAALRALLPPKLYCHQAEAFDATQRRENVILATGTNSGKSLGFLLPVLTTHYTEPAARSILVYPTKALAQDQLERIRVLVPVPAEVGVYDGDTSPTARARLRQHGRIMITNPDMLHLGILGSHENWAKWMRTLSYFVFDEMHVYRGIFGAHVGNVFRRALRIAEAYHSHPRIIAGSATIANPAEHFQRLTGESGRLITHDGSPQGKRTVVFYNPPHVHPTARLSPNIATSALLTHLVRSDVKTLAFSRTRVSAELVGRYAAAQSTRNLIESYRAGYTIKERRDIETRLQKGKLMGLSATNAMELGIDIGQLDAVLINGYPGSISSFWQQAGRAGRGERDGLAIYIAHDDPLDQFLIRDPEILLRGKVESAVVNSENRNVLSRHLECAAFEMPLTVTDMNRFGASALELAEALDRQGRLTFRNGAFYSTAATNPAGDVNIRTSDGEVVRLLCNGEEIGSMEKWRALRAAHEGAVYLHRGQTYLVQHLDLNTLTAVIQTTEVPYYTQAVVESIVLPTGAIAQKGTWSLENVSVTTTVIGYRRRMIEGDQTLDVVDLDLPPQQFETIGVRLNMLEPTPDTNPVEFLGAVHAAEHALLAVAPILAGCDRNDLGSSWTAAMPDTYLPGIVVYDAVPGGVGLAEKLYQERALWQRLARQLLASCKCDDGCPACLLSFRCESGNEPLNKSGAIALL